LVIFPGPQSAQLDKDDMLKRFSSPRLLASTAGLLALLLIAGCAPSNTTTDTDMDADRLRDFAARYTDAWSSRNADRVASFFNEGGSLKVNDGEPAVGREAIADVAQGFITAFPDLVLEMDSLRIEGETVEYYWTFSGTNAGPGGTGNRVRFSGFEAWSMDLDGLVLRSLGHFDEAEYQHQVEHGVDRP
jgi:uncharacterized protein (TIGR02246 family)